MLAPGTADAAAQGMRARVLIVPFLAVLLTGAACAPKPPVETFAAVAPARPPNEVRFELKTGDKIAGSIVVRSSGAYLGQVGAEQRTVIAVVLEIENSGTRPISVDPTELRFTSMRTSSAQLGELAPSGSSGRVEVSPGNKETAQAHFILPSDVTPAAVRSYDLMWIVHEPDGVAYRLTTSFVQEQGVIVIPPAYDSAPYPYHYYDGSVWYYGGYGPAWPHAHFVFVPHYRYYGHHVYHHHVPHGGHHGGWHHAH